MTPRALTGRPAAPARALVLALAAAVVCGCAAPAPGGPTPAPTPSAPILTGDPMDDLPSREAPSVTGTYIAPTWDEAATAAAIDAAQSTLTAYLDASDPSTKIGRASCRERV